MFFSKPDRSWLRSYTRKPKSITYEFFSVFLPTCPFTLYLASDCIISNSIIRIYVVLMTLRTNLIPWVAQSSNETIFVFSDFQKYPLMHLIDSQSSFRMYLLLLSSFSVFNRTSLYECTMLRPNVQLANVIHGHFLYRKTSESYIYRSQSWTSLW